LFKKAEAGHVQIQPLGKFFDVQSVQPDIVRGEEIGYQAPHPLGGVPFGDAQCQLVSMDAADVLPRVAQHVLVAQL
jgi:hypothetical protein